MVIFLSKWLCISRDRLSILWEVEGLEVRIPKGLLSKKLIVVYEGWVDGAMVVGRI